MSGLRSFETLACKHPKKIILLLALATLLPGLGNGWLWDRDETWYAGCALHMVKSGDWLIPGQGSRTFLEKPPLAYWFMAAGFQAFGFSEFLARLPSALLGTATLLLVYAVGSRSVSRGVGLLSAGVLATTLHFGVLSRAALTDPALVLGMTAAVLCYWRMAEPGKDPTAYWFWCLLGGISVGIAVLAKGPLGLLPGVIALVHMGVVRDFTFIKRAGGWLLLGLSGILIVGLPWYLLIWHRLGDDFIQEFFLDRNIRLVKSPIQGHSGPIFYYLPVTLFGMMPWTFFLLAIPLERRPFDRFDSFLAVWAAVPFVLFSLISTKLPHYIAPSIPPLAILAARDIHWRVAGHGPASRLLQAGFWFWAITGILFTTLSIGAFFVIEDFPVFALLGPGLILCIGFGLAVWWNRSRKSDLASACWACGITVTLFFLWITCVSLGQLQRVQVLTQAVIDATEKAAFKDGTASPKELFAYRYFEPSMILYSDGKMQHGKEEALETFLAGVPTDPVYVVCREKDLEQLTARLEEQGLEYEVTEYDALKMKAEFLRKSFRASKRYRIRLLEIHSPV